MGIVESKTFRTGTGVAVELPPEVAFAPGVSVTIERHGDMLTVRQHPSDEEQQERWSTMIEALRTLPRPPSVEQREPIEFPERPGL